MFCVVVIHSSAPADLDTLTCIHVQDCPVFIVGKVDMTGETPAQRAGVSPSKLRKYWSLLAESFQDHGERLGRAAPVSDDLDRVTDVLGTNIAQDSVNRGHRFVIDRGDNITGLEPSSLCAGPGRDLDDVDALGGLDVVLLSNRSRERGSLDTCLLYTS